jgi:ADP-ribose pyrophosphatase YjhB (NUDIX family)
MAIQKNAYMDINPVIITNENQIIFAKRTKNIVGGGQWHLPGGRVLLNETFEMTLKRVAFDKTNLQIELLYPSLKESLVGIYDDPKRDPREHVIGLAFLCKIVSGKIKPGHKVDEVKGFSLFEIKHLKIAFDHKKMVEDASDIVKERKTGEVRTTVAV